MNKPNIIDSLQSRSEKQKIISEIKNLVLEKLWNHTRTILWDDLDKKLSPVLNQEQINSLVQTQIIDILTNSHSLQWKLNWLSSEEVEDIINDLETQYLSQLYPNIASIEDLKSDYDMSSELKLEQSVIQDRIDEKNQSLISIQKQLSDISEQSSHFVTWNSDLSALNNMILWDINAKKNTELLSILESNNFDVESIHDDDEYNKVLVDLPNSEIIKNLIWETRISRIIIAIWEKKELIQELINLSHYLSENKDYDKNMKLEDFIELSKKKERDFRETWEKIWNELLEIQSSMNTDKQRLIEIDSELSTHESENNTQITHVNNTNNIDVLIDELKSIADYVSSNSDLVTDNSLQNIINKLEVNTNNDNYFDELHTVINSLLLNSILSSKPENIIEFLQKFEKYCSNNFIWTILADTIATYSILNNIDALHIYLLTVEKYNFKLISPIILESENIDRIKQLDAYNPELIKNLFHSEKLLIAYTHKSDGKTRKIDFGIKLPVRKYKKCNSSYKKAFWMSKNDPTYISFEYIDNQYILEENVLLEWKNSLGISSHINVKASEMKELISDCIGNDNTSTRTRIVVDTSTIVNKILKHYAEPYRKYFDEHHDALEKIYNSYTQEQSDNSLPILADDNVIWNAITQLNNAEAKSPAELMKIVLKIRKYFSDLAETSLDKSLWRKVLWSGWARGLVGIILSNDLSLYKRYLELNNTDLLNKIISQSEQTGESVDKLLSDVLDHKRSTLERRIFTLTLWKDYKLKNLENFDISEMLEYYNLTFVRHSVEDFEELMWLTLHTFDRKISIKNPNAEPANFDMREASKIIEHWKLYRIIESLSLEWIQIDEWYNIKTQSEHYICYVKEHNKFIIASDSVWSVFIFDGNAIDSVKEFAKKSLRELVREQKWVEKKYNYADHEKSFRNIFEEIKRSDFWFFDEQLEAETDINVAEQDKVLQLFCKLFTEGLFQYTDVKSTPTFLNQWNNDINKIKKWEKAIHFETKIQELLSQNYNIDELYFWIKRASWIVSTYSVDQLYYDLWSSYRNMSALRWYSHYEWKLLESLVDEKLNWSNKSSNLTQVQKVEDMILQNHNLNQDNKNLLQLLSKLLNKDDLGVLIKEYQENSSVHLYKDLNIKTWIQSIYSLAYNLWIFDGNVSLANITKHFINLDKKFKIREALYNQDEKYLEQFNEADFLSTDIWKLFNTKQQALNFLWISWELSNNELSWELEDFNFANNALNQAIWIDEIDALLSEITPDMINMEVLLELINKISSYHITINNMTAVTWWNKIFSLKVKNDIISQLDEWQISKVNYIMWKNQITSNLSWDIKQYQKKYILWKLIEKFYFAS